jgi:hypothetical protein
MGFFTNNPKMEGSDPATGIRRENFSKNVVFEEHNKSSLFIVLFLSSAVYAQYLHTVNN